MAKKQKRTKKNSSLKSNMKYELIGIFCLFLAVLGSGFGSMSDGTVPKTLETVFRLLLGFWYFIVPIGISVFAIYIMVKRKLPNMIHKRTVGLLIAFGGVLLLHQSIVFWNTGLTVSNSTVFSYLTTHMDRAWDRVMAYMNGGGGSLSLGGGLTGALLFSVSGLLLSKTGALIASFFILLIGIVIFSEISIGEFIARMFKGFRASIFKMKDNRQKIQRTQKSNTRSKSVKSKKKEDEALISDPPQESVQEEVKMPDIAYSMVEKPKKTQTDSENEVPVKDTMKDTAPAEPMAEMENVDYQLPEFDLLKEPVQNLQRQDRSQIEAVVKKLEKTFDSFGVKAKVTKVHVGPAVTKYEVYPDTGVKVSKIVNLHDDLALALAAKDIRIEAPIPGKSAVGIEIPNSEIAMVSLREVLESHPPDSGSKLSFVLGRDISGEAIMAELNKMPHLLVAGATGSGKSVCINGIITSILMRAKPHEVKMMMIDPKKVELNVYNGIPHLLTPVVTDPKKASQALKKVVAEMERRYELFSETGTRNLEGYNEYIKKHNLESTDENNKQPFLPYIVVLVDELADLMMVASSDVEDAITRLAQMARAAGIHLIIATQRPSVDVITGVIKANIPSRIAFSVSSQTDSRTILDSGGAEKLLGRGDMLFIPVGSSKPTRIQGAFLTDEEVEKIVNHCVEQQKAQYQEEMMPEEPSEVKSDITDDLYDEAVQLIIEMQSASVSMLQRRFRIGYTRAARLIDSMEERGIVGPYEGSKPRAVLVSDQPEETVN